MQTNPNNKRTSVIHQHKKTSLIIMKDAETDRVEMCSIETETESQQPDADISSITLAVTKLRDTLMFNCARLEERLVRHR